MSTALDAYAALAWQVAVSRKDTKGKPMIPYGEYFSADDMTTVVECHRHNVGWFDCGVLIVMDRAKPLVP
jgi:hypothetical protein